MNAAVIQAGAGPRNYLRERLSEVLAGSDCLGLLGSKQCHGSVLEDEQAAV